MILGEHVLHSWQPRFEADGSGFEMAQRIWRLLLANGLTQLDRRPKHARSWTKWQQKCGPIPQWRRGLPSPSWVRSCSALGSEYWLPELKQPDGKISKGR